MSQITHLRVKKHVKRDTESGTEARVKRTSEEVSLPLSASRPEDPPEDCATRKLREAVDKMDADLPVPKANVDPAREHNVRTFRLQCSRTPRSTSEAHE